MKFGTGNAMMMLTLTLAAMMQVAWTSDSMIMYDTQKFMMAMMQNDMGWAEQLNVNVNVDVASVSQAARIVLRRLNALKSAEPENTLTAAASASVYEPKGVVSVNALHVVADVVSLHASESDALEFGLAVVAAAIKCDVLRHVAVQAHAIGLSLQLQPDAAVNAARTSAVWDMLVLYLEKLVQLKESVAVESKLYRTWVTVVERTVARSLAPDVLAPFQRLVDASYRSTCGKVVPLEELRDSDGKTENWNTADGIEAVFVKSQRALDDVFRRLPMKTTDRELWDVYLNRKELAEKLAAIAAEKTAAKGSAAVEKQTKAAEGQTKAAEGQTKAVEKQTKAAEEQTKAAKE